MGVMGKSSSAPHSVQGGHVVQGEESPLAFYLNLMHYEGGNSPLHVVDIVPIAFITLQQKRFR